MFNTVRSVSVQIKQVASNLFTSSHSFTGKVSPVIGTVRSHQASAGAGSDISINNQPSPTNTEKIQHAQEPMMKGDVMSHSLADEYTTRSDEEGFGGSYTGNRSLSGKEQEKIVYGNSPEYDKTQDSKSTEKDGK